MNQPYPKELSEAQREQLNEFRAGIDAIDDKLIKLLIERINIVSQVGKMKRSVNPDHCPLRPGREADMIRRIAEKFKGTEFSPAAATAIWRILIGASTAKENDLTISVFAPQDNDSLYWIAREYFGPFLNITRQPHINRVIGDVMNKQAAVGLIPELVSSSDEDRWWPSLLGSGGQMAQIFAHVPFVTYTVPGRQNPTSLAIGCIQPEPTEEDVSILVIEADHNTSQHRIQTVLTEAGLTARWIDIATIHPESRHHLLKVDGFINKEHPSIQTVIKKLDTALLHTYFLGSYAVPFTLKFDPTRD